MFVWLYVCEILFLMGNETLVCKLTQAAINLGLKFRISVVEQQQGKMFFNIAVLQIKTIVLISQYIARVVGMQRDIHKMEVKKER